MHAAARWPLIDAAKGLACATIVCHHLSIYGPMGQGAAVLAPDLLHWLSQYGRLAVQVFLAIGGFLAAASLASQDHANEGSNGAPNGSFWARIGRRYARLAMPYLAAVTLTVLTAALVRPWLAGDLVPAAPTVLQLLAHGLLLQDILGFDALSAGVWYVAIDFQLFVIVLVMLGVVRTAGALLPGLPSLAMPVMALAAASLFFFNRESGLDSTALYFFGAYGLGMLSWWIGQLPSDKAWWLGVALLAGVGVIALGIDWRSRIATALVTSLVLSLAQRPGGLSTVRWPPALCAVVRRVGSLGRISYSLFLIHFSVILLVSALFSRLEPLSPWVDALGMLATFGLSVGAASVLYRMVEVRPATWRAVLTLFAAMLACGAVVAHA